MAVDLEEQIIRTAHHEAGHLVAAAVQGLKLRIEGLAVDARGEGLACYCKRPGESDEHREKVLVTTFSGYNSEARLCSDRGYAPPDGMQLIFSCDALEARPIISTLSYLSPTRTAFQIEEELQLRSRALIEERWDAIRSIADLLLARPWEPIRPLASGGTWSRVDSAKYMDGRETAERLASHGINAEVAESC